ncbi:hypothetical protein [Candidatus Nitrospira bockiana]
MLLSQRIGLLTVLLLAIGLSGCSIGNHRCGPLSAQEFRTCKYDVTWEPATPVARWFSPATDPSLPVPPPR